MEEKTYNLYDSINTTAVRWLEYNTNLIQNSKSVLEILNFNRKDIRHLWMLHIFDIYSIFNGYCKYYTDSNFFTYLYLKYIKGFKRLGYHQNNINYVYVEVPAFIKELTEAFSVKSSVIDEIYNEYWRK